MNYYNENDLKAVAWLRELIREGHIADGIVDERSIEDVSPNDLRGFRQCHFFAGIGGWSLALRLAGVSDDEEIWTGSCPCQPFSNAGKQKGKKDKRHLAPVMLQLIAQCAPPVVFGEQVASKLGREWLAGIRADLESLGYEVGAADLCAAGVGAPHIRQRLWWVAHSLRHGRDKGNAIPSALTHAAHLGLSGEGIGGLAHARHATGRRPPVGRPDGEGEAEREEETVQSGRCGGLHMDGLADSEGIRRAWAARGTEPARVSRLEHSGAARGLAHASGVSGTEHGEESRPRQGAGPHHTTERSAARGLGNAHGAGCEQHGGPKPVRAEQFPAECRGGLGGAWARFDLIPCADGKTRRIESGTFPLVDGFPGRVGLLRGYGNAIVPQEGAKFIRAALEAIKELLS